MRTLYSLCSESSAIDQSTNRVSMFHVIERINAASFPFFVPQIHYVTLFSREDSDPMKAEMEFRVSIGQKIVFSSPVSIEFEENKDTRFINDFGGLPIPNPGILEFYYLYREIPIGLWRIFVSYSGESRRVVSTNS